MLSPRRNAALRMSLSGPVKAGTTIITEEPFVYILSTKEHGMRCDHCFIKAKLLKCSGCQYIYYCGRICQKEAWPEHKAECAGYRRVLPRVPPDAARLMARIVRKLAAGGGHSKGYYANNKFRVWMDLMSHYHDLKKDNRRMEHFTSLCAILFQFLTDLTLPNSAELMGIYGRMVINSFTILDAEMISVGTGLYLGTSILDHSCSPNAVATFTGKTINIKLTQDMQVFDWSKVFISYIDLLNSPLDRQSELSSIYYFLCQCDRCLDSHQMSLLQSARCPNRDCDYPVQIPWEDGGKLLLLSQDNAEKHKDLVPYAKIHCDVGEEKGLKNSDSPKAQTHNESPKRTPSNGVSSNGYTNGHSNGGNKLLGKFSGLSLSGLDSDDDEDLPTNSADISCPKCGTRADQDFVERFRSVMEFSRGHLDNMRDKSVTYVDVCSTCLERQNGVLHPLNLYHVKTLDHAMDGCIQYQMWEKAARYALELLPGFKNYYGVTHPLYGLLLLKLGKILVYLESYQDAILYLNMAERVLEVTHGKGHCIVTQCLYPLYRQAQEVVKEGN